MVRSLTLAALKRWVNHVNRLRNRLIAVFMAGTLLPLGALLWLTSSLLDRSLSYAVTDDLDALSRSLEQTARLFYQDMRQHLKDDVAAGRVKPSIIYNQAIPWPPAVKQFHDSGEPERFSLSGSEGDQLDYLVRDGGQVRLFTRQLGNLRLEPLTRQYRQVRHRIEELEAKDLRRGFTLTLILFGAGIWSIALVALIAVAHHISRPILELTAGLADLSAGQYQTRLRNRRRDEIGRAVKAFNNTAAQLEQNRDRLVYLTQVASWQLLARKMAHELKNSLTPIRLNVEEILARQSDGDRTFLQQAIQIIIEEIETLERRVRAFSEFSSEPSPKPVPIEINRIAEERVELLRVVYPGIEYRFELRDPSPVAYADPDHVKGILMNLLENAAEAMPVRGKVLVVSGENEGRIWIEVHDSGPGLNPEMRRSLFEPTISFKKNGLGLGLSISRKNALLAGGDLLLIDSRVGGAAFRLVLPGSSQVRV